MRLGAPREREVRAKSIRMPGPEMRNLTTLAIQLSTELTRDIKHTTASVVVAHVKQIILDPHVVRAGFGDGILCHLSRIHDVRYIHDVHDAANRRARVLVAYVKDRRKHLVTDKNVILITKHRVCARKPAVAVKLVMIEAKLADEHRFLGTAALHAIANVEDDQPVAPVSQIRETVFHLEVVQVAPGGRFALFCFDRRYDIALDLP